MTNGLHGSNRAERRARGRATSNRADLDAWVAQCRDDPRISDETKAILHVIARHAQPGGAGGWCFTEDDAFIADVLAAIARRDAANGNGG